MEKRGISPVIATILLISMGIILALIVFLWARSFISEKTEKFGSAIELACSDINFEAELQDDGAGSKKLAIVNRGNVPIYGVDVKKAGEGSVKNVMLFSEETGNPPTLDIGETAELSLDSTDYADATELKILPVILGTTDEGTKTYTCKESEVTAEI